MQAYLLRRVVASVPAFFAVTVIVFIIIRVIPGDVVDLMLDNPSTAGVSQDQAAALRRQLGLDRPLPIQYWQWLKGFLTGDLGESVWTHQPVMQEAVRRLPVTLELTLFTAVFATVLGLGAGVLSAVFQGSAIDYVLRVVSIGGLSAPGFWLATLLIVGLSNYFGYLPPPEYKNLWVSPWTNLQQMIWPALILGVGFSASTLRMTRASMLEVLRQDYIRTARAKGLAERLVTLRHALKNALVPVITLIGAQIGFLLGGTVIMESIFSLPGVGQLTIGAISRRDYPQLQINVVLLTISYLVLNLIIDLGYSLLDPRIGERYR